MLELPEELILEALSYLKLRECLEIFLVNKYFATFQFNFIFWRFQYINLLTYYSVEKIKGKKPREFFMKKILKVKKTRGKLEPWKILYQTFYYQKILKSKFMKIEYIPPYYRRKGGRSIKKLKTLSIKEKIEKWENYLYHFQNYKKFGMFKKELKKKFKDILYIFIEEILQNIDNERITIEENERIIELGFNFSKLVFEDFSYYNHDYNQYYLITILVQSRYFEIFKKIKSYLPKVFDRLKETEHNQRYYQESNPFSMTKKCIMCNNVKPITEKLDLRTLEDILKLFYNTKKDQKKNQINNLFIYCISIQECELLIKYGGNIFDADFGRLFPYYSTFHFLIMCSRKSIFNFNEIEKKLMLNLFKYLLEKGVNFKLNGDTTFLHEFIICFIHLKGNEIKEKEEFILSIFKLMYKKKKDQFLNMIKYSEKTRKFYYPIELFYISINQRELSNIFKYIIKLSDESNVFLKTRNNVTIFESFCLNGVFPTILLLKNVKDLTKYINIQFKSISFSHDILSYIIDIGIVETMKRNFQSPAFNPEFIFARKTRLQITDDIDGEKVVNIIIDLIKLLKKNGASNSKFYEYLLEKSDNEYTKIFSSNFKQFVD